MRKKLLSAFLCIMTVFMITGCDLLKSDDKADKPKANKPDLIPLETTKKAVSKNDYKELSEEAIEKMQEKMKEYNIYSILINISVSEIKYASYKELHDICGSVAEAVDFSLPPLRELYQMSGEYEELKEFREKLKKAIEISPNKYSGNDIMDLQNYLYHVRDFYDAMDEVSELFDEAIQ